MMRLAVWLLVLLGMGGCSPFQRPGTAPPDFRVVSDVPFYRQDGTYDCGPAALASLLAHKGQPMSADHIRQQVYSPVLRGSLLPDMENYARQQGLATRSGRGDLDLLRRQIDAGRPVLIPLEMGWKAASAPHYIVVFGYTDAAFLVHAGEKQSVLIASDQLLPRWEKLNRLYLYLE